MGTLAISELHSGAWTADPLQRHDVAVAALDTQSGGTPTGSSGPATSQCAARPARDLI
jgi:hypothetical protein